MDLRFLRLVVLFAFQVNAEEGFYNIAHMVNTKLSVDWALGRGANAVEVDLAFHDSTGNLNQFRHSAAGESCDCTCKCPAPIWGLCRLYTSHVCSVLIESSSRPCMAQSSVSSLLRHLGSKTQLALVIIDSKIEKTKMSVASIKRAGQNVVRALNSNLFAANYRGKVIIGSPKLDTLPYLESAVKEASKSPYKSRIYFTVDLEKNNVVDTLTKLHTLSTSNIVYGTGISACAPRWLIKDSTLKIAAINKARGVSGLTYIWNLDKKSSMKRYLPYVQGLMTNYPGDLADVLLEAGIKLATPSSTIPLATSSSVVTSSSGYNCDCDYHPGGCSISRAAPRGLACKCKYRGFWTCGGDVVQCRDPQNNYCKNPDKTVQSCFQGNGDCEGYKTATCDCDYHPGGCSISRAPPPYTACRCIYKGAWTCGGRITRCKNENSRYCKQPDKSVNTCILGGGDCSGYKLAKCDCNYHPGGCSISQAAPADTACKCVYKGFWTCGGEIVRCLDFSSRYCKSPDKSVQSCFQGNGDCEGYKTATCDCDYHRGGCTISKVPPPHTACKCKYKGWWTCGGDITRCRNPTSRYCSQPDSSRNTCLLGGGDCGGY